MEITYAESYVKHGCSFHGHLVIAEVSKRARQLEEGKPLDGFGSMSHYDAIDEAKAVISERHPSHEVLLGIPELVVRVDPQEWMDTAGAIAQD